VRRETIIVNLDCDVCKEHDDVTREGINVVWLMYAKGSVQAYEIDLCSTHNDESKLIRYARTFGRRLENFQFKPGNGIAGTTGRLVESPSSVHPVAQAARAIVNPTPVPKMHNPVIPRDLGEKLIQSASRPVTVPKQREEVQKTSSRTRNPSEDVRVACTFPGCKSYTSLYGRKAHANKVHDKDPWDIEWVLEDPTIKLVKCDCGMGFLPNGTDPIRRHMKLTKCPAWEIQQELQGSNQG
jgi:hypothetical protein